VSVLNFSAAECCLETDQWRSRYLSSGTNVGKPDTLKEPGFKLGFKEAV